MSGGPIQVSEWTDHCELGTESWTESGIGDRASENENKKNQSTGLLLIL